MKKEVIIWSEGIRMAADLFLPDDLREGEKRPAILLCHGWAGLKSHLSATYAPYFCKGGFVCLTFDYRGWFESDARIVTPEKQPPVDADGFITVRGKPVREIVDPLDQNRDINNALDYLFAEPAVDPSRIGLWGSSFGGGHVLYVAGHDPRIKAVVSRVPGMGPVPDQNGFTAPASQVQKLASAMARREIDALPRPQEQPSHSRVSETSERCGDTFRASLREHQSADIDHRSGARRIRRSRKLGFGCEKCDTQHDDCEISRVPRNALRHL